LKSAALTTAALVASAGTLPPDVPWWGQLIMAIVSVALAFFGGAARAARDAG